MAKLQKKERNFNPPEGRTHKEIIDEMRHFNEKTCFKPRHLKKSFTQWKNGQKIGSKKGAMIVGLEMDDTISKYYGYTP